MILLREQSKSNMNFKQQINDYIQSHKKEIVDTLNELIKIPSVRGNAEENAPFAAQVFKTVVDPYSGKLSYIKSFRGVLKSGSTVWNSNTEQEERIGQIYVMRGKKMEAVDQLEAGDIGAVNKLNNTSTGDTLCDVNAKVRFPAIVFPKPTLFMAVTSEKKGEEDKVFAGLAKLAEEDFTFSVEKNAATGELLLGGHQADLAEDFLQRNHPRQGGSGRQTQEAIGRPRTIRARQDSFRSNGRRI